MKNQINSLEELEAELRDFKKIPDKYTKEKILIYLFKNLIKLQNQEKNEEDFIPLLISMNLEFEFSVLEDVYYIVSSYEDLYPEYVQIISKFYLSLDQRKRILYWNELIKNNCTVYLFGFLQVSKDDDIFSIIVNLRSNGYISEELFNILSQNFFKYIRIELFKNRENCFLEDTIKIKNIKIPKISNFPFSNDLDFNKLNIFIGKNNESKSRFLKFLGVLLEILRNIDEFNQGQYDYKTDDNQINWIFERGVIIEVEILKKVSNEQKLNLWGWKFQKYDIKNYNVILDLKQGKVSITTKSSFLLNLKSPGWNFDEDTEFHRKIVNTLKNYLKPTYLKDVLDLIEFERRPSFGWDSFSLGKEINNTKENFRGILEFLR